MIFLALPCLVWAPSTDATGESRSITQGLQSLHGHQQRVAVLPPVVHHDVDMGVAVGDVLLAVLRPGRRASAPLTRVTSSPPPPSSRSRTSVATAARSLPTTAKSPAIDAEHVAGLARAGHRDRLPGRDGDRAVAGVAGGRGHLEHVGVEAAGRLVDGERGEALDLRLGRDHRHPDVVVLLGGPGGDLRGPHGVVVVGQDHDLGGAGARRSPRGASRSRAGGRGRPRSRSRRRRRRAGPGRGRRRPRRSGGRCAPAVRLRRGAATCSAKWVTRTRCGRPAAMPASIAAPTSSTWTWTFHSPSPPTTTSESPSGARASRAPGRRRRRRRGGTSPRTTGRRRVRSSTCAGGRPGSVRAPSGGARWRSGDGR